MREERFANGTIRFPEFICFAFNRNLIEVEAQTDYVRFVFNIDGRQYEDLRYTKGYKLQFDISSYLRLPFKVDDSLMTEKYIEVTAYSDYNESITFEFNVIWGALYIGDTFNGSRNITFFRHFPQTVSMYLASDDIVSVYYDGVFDYDTDIGGNGNIVHVDLSKYFGDAGEDGCIWIEKGGSKSVFTYQFDDTFLYIENRVIIGVSIDDSECGLFLRWIDRHGFYQYYLFTEGDSSLKVDDIGDDTRTGPKNLPEQLRQYYGIVQGQGRNRQTTIKACALSLNKETFKMVLDLPSSPIVHLYKDGLWVPVKIVAGTYTETDDELQDFEIQIQLPATDVQRL